MPKLRIKTKESRVLRKEQYLQKRASNVIEIHVYITVIDVFADKIPRSLKP